MKGWGNLCKFSRKLVGFRSEYNTMEMVIIFITLFSTIAFCFFAYYKPPEIGWYDFKKGRDLEDFLVSGQYPDAFKLNHKTDRSALAKWLYKERLACYKDNVRKIDSNLLMQLVLIGFSLYILWQNPKQYGLKSLGINISGELMHFAVPAGLLFFWLGFGFLLSSAIDTRIALMKLIMFIESDGEKRVHDFYSNLNALEAGGLLDAWFTVKYLYFTRYKEKWLFVYLIFIMYGLFFGLAHACTVAVLCAGRYRYRKISKMLRVGYAVIAYLFLFMIISSHALFYFGGVHKNPVQLAIAISAILFMFVLLKITREE